MNLHTNCDYMANLDYYKILRLKSFATPKEISDMYRDLSILYKDSKEPLAKEIMKIIDQAYLVLQDPNNRASYDLEREISTPESLHRTKLSEAEKTISLWGANFTTKELEYIDKIHSLNKIIRVAVIIIGIIFLFSVITFRLDISFLLIFGIWFLRNIIWSIYRIKILLFHQRHENRIYND